MATKLPDITSDHEWLADYIVDWLTTRNGAELAEAIYNMRVRDFECLKGELKLILACGGKPPNWV